MMNIQSQAYALQEENQKLKEMLKENDRMADISKLLVFENNAYFLEKEGGRKDGPFCSRCWDVHKRLVRLHIAEEFGYGFCPECNDK